MNGILFKLRRWAEGGSLAILLATAPTDASVGAENEARIGLMRAVSETYDVVNTPTEPASLPGAAAPITPKAPEPAASSALELPALPASLEVRRDNTVVRIKPTNKVRRRGVVMAGARLPLLEESEGPGCGGSWFRVMEEGWICEDDGRRSNLPPSGADYPVLPKGQITPWPYGFVRESTLEYRKEGGLLVEMREVLKGFGFGVADTVRIDGTSYFETAEGTFIPRKDAGIAGRISDFEGTALSPSLPNPIGFVVKRHATAWSAPAQRRENRIGTVERYKPFEVLDTSGTGRNKFYRFDEGAWLAARDVRTPRPASLPKGIKPGERWIDVDTARQMITAYEGETPVYITLISSGRVSSPTVKGEYRIWAKIAAIAMDNTDEALEAESPPDADTETSSSADTDTDTDTETTAPKEPHLYSLHDVPWTQFFFESFALHGVYWHDAFGNRRSHGCVNLSPKDAAWFYNWTEPRIPPGFWAVHSTAASPGTLVRIR